MSILFLAIPLAMILGTGLFLGFIWSVQSGQLDDLETPAHRILIDNEEIVIKENL
jgi:cbb3-type cytochrome oxidase maturation protein